MEFINLTPHALNIHFGSEILVIPPSGEIARVASVSTDAGPVGGIPTVRTQFGEVTGLPEPKEDVFLIVSGMVASAAPRPDVLSPGELVRDEDRRPIGCLGLRRSI